MDRRHASTTVDGLSSEIVDRKHKQLRYIIAERMSIDHTSINASSSCDDVCLCSDKDRLSGVLGVVRAKEKESIQMQQIEKRTIVTRWNYNPYGPKLVSLFVT